MLANQRYFGDVLTLGEFCEYTRISLRHFYAMAKRGQAPETVRIGQRRLVRKKTADAWIAAREAA